MSTVWSGIDWQLVACSGGMQVVVMPILQRFVRELKGADVGCRVLSSVGGGVGFGMRLWR